LNLLKENKGINIKIKIEKIKAIVPPNLLGIDRKIAYANKKYHSGWIWTGVDIGLEGKKLSESLNIYGALKIKINKIIKKNNIPIKSLIINK